MGSPSYCYREFMIEYILLNIRMSKYESTYTPEYLRSLTEEELEKLTKQFNKTYRNYGAFLAGMSVSNFLSKWQENGDMINAACGGMSDLFALLNIYEPDTVDFEEL